MNKDMINPGLMTEKTYKRLQDKLEELEKKITKNQLEQGETMDSAQDWHDNGAYDELLRSLSVLISQRDDVRARICEVEIIESRKDTTRVGIGNTVVVRYSGEDAPEMFTILGTADNDTDRSWISAATPLGRALLEKKAGDTVSISSSISVTLIKILAGQF